MIPLKLALTAFLKHTAAVHFPCELCAYVLSFPIGPSQLRWVAKALHFRLLALAASCCNTAHHLCNHSFATTHVQHHTLMTLW